VGLYRSNLVLLDLLRFALIFRDIFDLTLIQKSQLDAQGELLEDVDKVIEALLWVVAGEAEFALFFL
jgi:hypothetical protein